MSQESSKTKGRNSSYSEDLADLNEVRTLIDAAQKGVVSAQERVGNFFLDGNVLPKNDNMGAFWINLSKEKRTPSSRKVNPGHFTLPLNHIMIKYEYTEEITITPLYLIYQSADKARSIVDSEIAKIEVAREKAEKDRLKAERKAKEKAEKERLEAERKAREKAEKERLEAERKAREKAEEERLEAERKAREKAEEERLESERKAREQVDKERREAEAMKNEVERIFQRVVKMFERVVKMFERVVNMLK